MTNQNTGHGWVRPRPDGAKARCGGPALCKVCWEDLRDHLAQKEAEEAPEMSLREALEIICRAHIRDIGEGLWTLGHGPPLDVPLSQYMGAWRRLVAERDYLRAAYQDLIQVIGP